MWAQDCLQRFNQKIDPQSNHTLQIILITAINNQDDGIMRLKMKEIQIEILLRSSNPPPLMVLYLFTKKPHATAAFRYDKRMVLKQRLASQCVPLRFDMCNVIHVGELINILSLDAMPAI